MRNLIIKIIENWRKVLAGLGIGGALLGGGFYTLQSNFFSIFDFVSGTPSDQQVVTYNAGTGTAIWADGGGGGGTAKCTLAKTQLCNLSHDQICDVYFGDKISPTSTSVLYNVQYKIPGLNQTLAGVAPSSGNFTVHDENISNRTWIDEAGNTGHFSGAKDTKVVVNTRAMINGNIYNILSIVGDGTGAGSVTLDGDPGADFAITWIYGLDFATGSLGVYGYFDDTAPTNTMFVATQNTTTTLNAIINLNQMSQVYYADNLLQTNLRIALSQDGAYTSDWYAFNGTNWVTCNLNNIETCGMLVDNNGYPYNLLASDGSAMSSANWDAYPINNAKGWKLAYGALVLNNTNYLYIQDDLEWKYDAIDQYGEINFGMPGFQFAVATTLVATSTDGKTNMMRFTANSQGGNTTYASSTVFIHKCIQ